METIVYQAWAKDLQPVFSLKHFMLKAYVDEAIYPEAIERVIIEQFIRGFESVGLEIELVFMYEEDKDEEG